MIVAADPAELLRSFAWMPGGAMLARLERRFPGVSRVFLGRSVGHNPGARLDARFTPCTRGIWVRALICRLVQEQRDLRKRGDFAVPIDHGLSNATVSHPARDMHPSWFVRAWQCS